MRILLDTNVLISGFIAHGACAELIEHCAHYHVLVTSEFILEEFKEKLVSKFGFSDKEATRAVELMRTKFKIYDPTHLPHTACNDPNDLAILGSALAGECHCIITGDGELLKMNQYQHIDIISPSNFWKYEERK